jgi:hypothetical protein
MGRYDDIDPDTLRADLRYFANLILRLDADGRLLEATPRILHVLGNLRAKIFAYEVRFTGRLEPAPQDDPPEVREARRIILEAERRYREAEEEWRGDHREPTD